jgi:hypothetical protein
MDHPQDPHLDLPADAPMSTVVGLLFGDEHPYPTYNLLACLLETMKALECTDANTLAEYVKAVADQVVTDMLEDEVGDRTLRPGLLDATGDFDNNTSTIN